MTNRIRKQVDQLTLDDLSASVVWEFAVDEEGAEGQDEATVRPIRKTDALDPSTGMFVVAARFWLADGIELRGYLTPPFDGENSLDVIQPQIVTDSGQVAFWCGRCPPDTTLAYQRLSREAASVFPIRFESIVPLVNGLMTGTIPGFLCLEDDFETVRVVQ